MLVVMSTLLNAAYFLPIIFRAFFAPEPAVFDEKIKTHHGEAGLRQVTSLMVTATLVLVLFFYPDSLLALIDMALMR